MGKEPISPLIVLRLFKENFIRMSTPNLAIFLGKVTEHILPTGRRIKMRETNGADEDLLSNMDNLVAGSNFAMFLSSIITEEQATKESPVRTTVPVEDIMNWPINDIWAAIYKQRLINQGPSITFKHQCQNPNCVNHKNQKTFDYVEDLTQFDSDLSKPLPQELKNPWVLKPYPNKDKTEVEFTISSGKTFKYKILTGILQTKQLDLNLPVTKNTKLLVRELQLKNRDEWQPVLNFNPFSSAEMREMRGHIEKNDVMFTPMSNFSCPTCKTPYQVGVMEIPGFYWPEEVQ